MKRLIYLLTLIICSFTISFGATQTWRLTNDGYSDSLPKISRDNNNNIYIAWLSDVTGNYDLKGCTFNGTYWSSPYWWHVDGVPQKKFDICYNAVQNAIYTVWDSLGWTNGYRYQIDSSKYTYLNVSTISAYNQGSGCAVFANDSGVVYFAFLENNKWVIRGYNNGNWATLDSVLTDDPRVSNYYYLYGAYNNNTLLPCLLTLYSASNMGSYIGRYVVMRYWCADSSNWLNTTIIGYQPPTNPYTDYKIEPFSLRQNDSTLLIVYRDSIDMDSVSLLCNKYTIVNGVNQLDTIFKINSHTKATTGELSQSDIPRLAWSDGFNIVLNTFYDTVWSQNQVRISDSTLTNCINPDIVAENDSTVWVCYQSDGEIYVTRTSVPLGVEGNRPEPNKIAVKPFIHAYPNPASNRVNISYNNNGPAVISIYDITGGRIRSLTANNGQAVWDCRNGQGIQVSSGVYFIRARQDNNEIIKKINIVR